MRTLRACLLAAFAAALLPACKSELVCPEGKLACGGHCVSALSDAANCGACGITCGSGAVCQGGACACPADLAACTAGCAALGSDPAHCGSCGTACGAAEVCSAGACASACGAGQTPCDRACVDLSADRLHCGACGTACGPGQTCRGGSCAVDILVACYATDEVLAVAPDLTPAGSWTVPSGPTAVALGNGFALSANGYPSAGVSFLPFTAGVPVQTTALPGSDLQAVRVHEGLALVVNSGRATLSVVDASGLVLDDIPLGNVQTGLYPHAVAVAGARAYVTLSGTANADRTGIQGQAVAVVDLTGLSACRVPDPAGASCDPSTSCGASRNCVAGRCRDACGALARTIDVLAVPGSSDGAGLPFPSGVVAFGPRVLVSLSNLEYGTAHFATGDFSGWIRPAGSGRLLVLDEAAATARIVDLGQGCKNPGAMALAGSTLWVACGSTSFPAEAPGAVLPVSLAAEPTVGQALALPAVSPGSLAFCGGTGYVADQGSGTVVTFDPAAQTIGPRATVCATGSFGYAWAADIACAP